MKKSSKAVHFIESPSPKKSVSRVVTSAKIDQKNRPSSRIPNHGNSSSVNVSRTNIHL